MPTATEQSPNLEHVLAAFPDWFLNFDEEEQWASLALYQLLANGEPVSKQALANATNTTLDNITMQLEKWSGLYYNDNNEIVGYWGLSVVEMPHKFIVNGKTLYTWCAWDALFIPPLLGQTAVVESTCPISGDLIRLTVTPQGVESFTPSTTLLTFVEPPASDKFHDDVINHFCHYVNFVTDENAAKQWQKKNQHGFVFITPHAGFDLGQLKNRAQYDLLKENS